MARHALLLFVALCASPQLVAADTIRITSGSLHYEKNGGVEPSIVFAILGHQFQKDGVATPEDGLAVKVPSPIPLVTGALTDLSSDFSIDPEFFPSSITWHFVTPRVPVICRPDEGSITVCFARTVFTFSGDFFIDGQRSAHLVGNGVATGSFEEFIFAGRPSTLDYHFAAAVPEPATFLLFGTGAVALMRRKRQQCS